MRGPLIALILGAVGVCGCGGGLSDTEQVQATVDGFGKATAAKDYQRLCDELLAPALVEEVESSGLPCESALREGLGDVQAPTLTIGAIEVDGDKATAEVNSAAKGQPPSRDTLRLARVDDQWRIASLAGN